MEKKLIAKGYCLSGKKFGSYDEAKAYAKELRAEGYRACVVVYSTAIRGYHDYRVWYK